MLYRNHDQRTSPLLPLDDNTILTTPPRSTICPIHSRFQAARAVLVLCRDRATTNTRVLELFILYFTRSRAIICDRGSIGYWAVGNCTHLDRRLKVHLRTPFRFTFHTCYYANIATNDDDNNKQQPPNESETEVLMMIFRARDEVAYTLARTVENLSDHLLQRPNSI